MSNYPRIPIAQTVVRLSERYGIDRIVICAGSRNAPLTNGFVSQDYFKTYSIVDERAAAFFALGMAQQLKKPVALVCTSGSALLNFYPAIAEAYYSDIPLVVISADRMPHRIDICSRVTSHLFLFVPFYVDQAPLMVKIWKQERTFIVTYV